MYVGRMRCVRTKICFPAQPSLALSSLVSPEGYRLKDAPLLYSFWYNLGDTGAARSLRRNYEIQAQPFAKEMNPETSVLARRRLSVLQTAGAGEGTRKTCL